MIYPNITTDDIHKWCYIGGEDGSQHIPGQKIYLDEDEHCFGKLLSLIDVHITSNPQINKLKSITKSEIKAYYQGRIDQVIETLANGIFNDTNAKVMAVPTNRFLATFPNSIQDIPYAIQYMLRLNGFEIRKDSSMPKYIEHMEPILPIKNSGQNEKYGQYLNEQQMKQILEAEKVSGLPSNLDHLISLGQSEKQKGEE
jgi:hypothetical protein